jgi:hypothetical protein
MKIISVVFNRPAYIPYQYECLKKFIEVPFDYTIFDNSDNPSIEKEFRELCEYLEIGYIRVPQTIHERQDPSSRAGKSLDFALQYMYHVQNYRGIVMVNDSDMFLVKPYNPIERLGSYHVIGRNASKIYQQHDLKDPTQMFTYYTNQHLILDYANLPNINDFSFLPTTINGVILDCGGKLDTYFQRNPLVLHNAITDLPSNYYSSVNIHECPTFMKEYFESEISIFQSNTSTDTTSGKAFSEIFDDAFIHLRAGSNWIGHAESIQWNRENNLFTFLCKKLIEWDNVIQPSETNKYVISYSLYGTSQKYCLNAIINALLANKIYVGWISRFYYDDTVPQCIISALRTIPNTECVFSISPLKSAGSERMLWRFTAASDPTITAMISRDCDSWLSFREAFSVKEWIRSDRGFHIIRDHCYHSQKIMGGMWGVKRGVIPDMKQLCDKFMETCTYDQGFLAEKIYPTILNNVCVHIGKQHTFEGNHTNGYFNDGGVPLVEYPRIREYIPTIDIEVSNKDNQFHCVHCKKTHDFFIGEMFNNLNQTIIRFLCIHFPMLCS